MLYLDTSVLVAALTRERRTPAVQVWLAEKPGGSLAISDWVVTEFSAALSVKLRTGQLDVEQRAGALSLFTALAEESFTRVVIGAREFHSAARYADQYEMGLRAGDSLHLAVTGSLGLRLVTLDRTLAKAATALGISSELL